MSGHCDFERAIVSLCKVKLFQMVPHTMTTNMATTFLFCLPICMPIMTVKVCVTLGWTLVLSISIVFRVPVSLIVNFSFQPEHTLRENIYI